MQFKDNFSEILLIAEQPVIFYLDHPYLIQTVDLIMKLPTLAQTLTDPHIQLAITVFQMPIAELKKTIHGVEFETIWELLSQLNKMQPGNQISRNVTYYLHAMFGDTFHEDEATKTWMLDRFEIDEELFNRIAEIAVVAAGLKDYKDQRKYNADKPQWLIDKENEIKRIKNQGKTKTGEYNNFQELTKILIPLNYELGYSFEELFAMNYYHIQFLSKYIPKMIGYDISKRQIMSKKKIKYITDK